MLTVFFSVAKKRLSNQLSHFQISTQFVQHQSFVPISFTHFMWFSHNMLSV